MKDIAKILLYLAATVVLGAALAPPLYWLCQTIAAHGYLPALAKFRFHSVFDRAVLIAALALLYPLARSMQIGSMAELGLRPNPRLRRDLGAGLAFSLLSSAVLIGCAAALHVWRAHAFLHPVNIARALLTAAVVPLIEEPLFRGALQGAVERSAPRRQALLFVASLYSIVHFLKPVADAPGPVTWASGFARLPMIMQFDHPTDLLGGFVTLLIVGVILGSVRTATASLWMPIGLHAGWILGVTAAKMGWVNPDKHHVEAAPWFGSQLLVGLCPVLVLLATGFAIRAWVMPPRLHEGCEDVRGSAKVRD